jgi:hypothetical protein
MLVAYTAAAVEQVPVPLLNSTPTVDHHNAGPAISIKVSGRYSKRTRVTQCIRWGQCIRWCGAKSDLRLSEGSVSYPTQA